MNRPVNSRVFSTALIAFALMLAFSGQAVRASSPAPYYGAVEAVIEGRRGALEQQPVNMRINAGPLQIGAPEVFHELAGIRSPIRIAVGSSYHFVGRSPGDGVDPSAIYKLFRAQPKRKKYRRIKISHSSFTEGFTFRADREAVPLRFETGRNALITIHPLTKLEPGEYAFVPINKAYAFGID